MNSGVRQFLEGEGSIAVSDGAKHDPAQHPEDFLKVAMSQEKAVHLLHQLSQDFTALLGVAKKIQNSHCVHTNQSHSEKDLLQERDQLKSTVQYLLQRTQTCEDSLQLAQTSFSNCNASVMAQVKARADSDADALSDMKS